MCRSSIGSGLHAVTREEINTAAMTYHVKRAVNPDRAHFEGFWPEQRTNASLRSALCDDCDYENCVSKCKFGKEAQRRVNAGEMAPCFGLRRQEVAS